jgi:molybdenum ABC transporter molybdate-binding protein
MRFLLASLLLLLTAATAAAQEAPPRAEPNPNLTLLADANLMLPVAQLARLYSSQHNTPLTVVLKNSNDAESQIMQGLEAHVLLTSNHALVERLADQGLTDVNGTKQIGRTQLALVAARDLGKEGILAKRISFAAMLNATPNLPVFVDAPNTPDGARAEALLTGYEFSDQLTARTVVKPTRDGVIAAIRDGHGLGLILATDAVGQSDLTVVSVLPESISPPVTYEVVVLASESMAESRQLASFLQSDKAQDIFAHFGFEPPTP